LYFFFFQAEDGIRYWSVTGVQTCALPIFIVRNTSKRIPRLPNNKTHRFLARSRSWRCWRQPASQFQAPSEPTVFLGWPNSPRAEIGRASCRERGEIAVDAGALKRK